MAETLEKQVSGKTKKMTLLNVIAAMVTSIFLIDSIAPAASAGSSTVIWYVILGIAFYIPYGFITAELSSKIPDEGGVYTWVKKMLGVGTAKRVAWYYWVNVGIWAPSIALYIAQLMAYMWFPGMQDPAMYNWITMLIAIGFMWASLGLSYFPISENAKLYTSATIGKIGIVIFMFVGMFTAIGNGAGPKTDLSMGAISKEFQDAGTAIMFLPALVYNILGLEAIAGEAGQIENPKKTMAKATLITTLVLLVFYIITTIALQYVFDTANAFDLTAIIAGMQYAFGINDMGAQILVNLLAITFMYTMFIETMGWVSGANAGIAESAENEEIPSIFKWRNKRGMPFKSTILLGIIGTIELILFTGIGQAVDPTAVGGGNLFWALFAASSNILFLAYFLMFAAYIKGKLTGELDGKEYTGYSNKKIIAIPMAVVASTVLAITYVLLLWSPGYDILTQTVPIIASVIAAMIAGEMCFMFANKKYRGNYKVSTKHKIVPFKIARKA